VSAVNNKKNGKDYRGTIFLEDATVVSQVEFPGEQYILTIDAPKCALNATPGSFAHLRCHTEIPMRRPLSIMRANPATGHVEFLYKIVGEGLRSLGQLHAGDTLSIMGPIGQGFVPSAERPRKLMVGGGVGIPPMLFLAEHLAVNNNADNALVLMGSEVPFPFELVTSGIAVNGVPDNASKSIADIEALGIAARLASLQDYSGVYSGYVTQLAEDWLQSMDETERSQVDMFACGPEAMLEAAAKVASKFNVHCQLSLEEFMACAVGGCAGCTVPVHLDDGLAMKRVCVDGPVFAASTIYPDS